MLAIAAAFVTSVALSSLPWPATPVVASWSPAQAAQGPQAELPPELEARANALYKRLICPVCPGETLDQSQATLARQMRGVIQEQLLAGESDEAVLAYFVSVYNESVLAAPPRRGVGLLAWAVPPLVLAGGAVGVYLVLRSLRRRTSAMRGVTPSPVPPSGLAPYLRAVDSELGAPDDRPGSQPRVVQDGQDGVRE